MAKMSEEMVQELKDLKNILNSIIVPNPNGLSLRHLCNDFQEIEGEMIPFRKFGFTSVTGLLKSMPDKVRMEGNLAEINSVTLYPVRTDDNRHIIDLVRGQNKTKKGKRGRSRPVFYPTRLHGFRSVQRPTTPRPLSRSSSNLYASHYEPTESQTYEALQQRLYSELWWAYYHYYEALTRTCPQLVLEQFGNNPYTHINHNMVRTPLLPNCVPTPRPVFNPTGAAPMRGYYPRTIVNHTPPLNPELLNKFQNFSITKQSSETNGKTSPISRSSRSASDVNSVVINNVPNRSFANTLSSGSGALPKNIKDNIRLLMTSEDLSDGMMLFNFQARYKHEFKEVLDHQKWGFDSLADCLKSVPHLIELIEIGKTFKLMPNKNPIEPEETNESNSVPLSPVRNGMRQDGMSSKASPTVSPTTIKTMPKLIRTVRSDSSSTASDNVLSNSSPLRTLNNTQPAPTIKMTSRLSTGPTGNSQPTPAMTTTSLTNSAAPTLPIFVPNVSYQSTRVKTTPNIQLTGKPTTTAVIATPTPDSTSSARLSDVQNQAEPVLGIPGDISPIMAPADTESVKSYESSANLNPIAKHNFRRVLMAHEKGIRSVDFPKEYQRLCNVSFDSRIWGFRTAMELFIGLPSIFTIDENDKKEVILHDARFKKFEKSKTINSDPTANYKLTQLSDKMKARIVRLVQLCGNTGLSVDDFARIYSLSYEPIDLASLRVPDADYLFQAIKHELPIKLYLLDGQKRAFIKSDQELREWVVSQTRLNRFVVPIIMKDTPANTVLPGEEYAQISLPDKFEPGNYEYVAIYISSAVNPQEIYIQFKGIEYHTALERMMFKLDFYETAPPEQWSVPYEFLYAGYPVICKYPGDRNWHRAKISRLHPNNKNMVTVYFVDYGGTTVIDYTSLRLMKREFLQLPIQALKVGLYGIKPVNGNRISDWTTVARDKILKFSKPLYALACTLIQVRNGIHWVAICDTNGDTDIFLHSVLVADKVALLKNEDELEDEDRQPQTGLSVATQLNGQLNGF